MMLLKLHLNIYNKNCIEKAKEAFDEYSDIDFEFDDTYCFVNFSNCKYDEKSTVYAFENYLIGLENL